MIASRGEHRRIADGSWAESGKKMSTRLVLSGSQTGYMVCHGSRPSKRRECTEHT